MDTLHPNEESIVKPITHEQWLLIHAKKDERDAEVRRHEADSGHPLRRRFDSMEGSPYKSDLEARLAMADLAINH